MLCDLIAASHLQHMQFHGYEAKRKVASFGYNWSFEHRTLSKGEDIPRGFRSIVAKVANQLSMRQENFAELLLTEYPPDSVINWHRDAPPFDLIAGISLLSDCVFRFDLTIKPIKTGRRPFPFRCIPVHYTSFGGRRGQIGNIALYW